MAFPRKYLNDGEEIVLDLRPHWLFLFGPSAALIGALAAGHLGRHRRRPAGRGSWFPVAGARRGRAAVLPRAPAQWITTDFVLTTDRLIYRKGIVSRQGREIPLERINDISFNQSLFERMLRAGDLLVESGGERGQSCLRPLRRPPGHAERDPPGHRGRRRPRRRPHGRPARAVASPSSSRSSTSCASGA